MTRFHTSTRPVLDDNGNQIGVEQVDVAFTAEEELEWDAREAGAGQLVICGVWDAIKSERDRRKAGGVLVTGKWFHSDDPSRIQQIGLVMMGANIPPGLQWKTMDGTFVTMTQALANQIFQAVAAQDQAIFAKAEQHKAAMEASANPAAYDFSSGWPPVYGE
ncbi:MAG TPA: DUF4376 domain-containing protein [Noviherbaspirillum sp.]